LRHRLARAAFNFVDVVDLLLLPCHRPPSEWIRVPRARRLVLVSRPPGGAPLVGEVLAEVRQEPHDDVQLARVDALQPPRIVKHAPLTP
tara:strand:- start:88 stop:354 length:267 start_codon:yes stop_codon:yes gene_type:complete